MKKVPLRGAAGSRQGYFEVANGGTIFLDEVAELPMQTQVRLLRVLETGEFLRVGASKSLKTNVRVVAATNENMQRAIAKGKFREDLFYRLSAIPIQLPALRERGEDIHLLFRKFASDFADRYRMPGIRLTPEAITLLTEYPWPGNIRQLKNTVEQISIIETERNIDALLLRTYLPIIQENSPALVGDASQEAISERELMYKFLFEMKKDLTELKKLVVELLSQSGNFKISADQHAVIDKLYQDFGAPIPAAKGLISPIIDSAEDEFIDNDTSFVAHEEFIESLSLEEREKELIIKALEKHRGKRKYAAKELGISERTLYRKIKEYNLAE
jgi:DNA-binding NtrC family response regulator